MKSATLFRLLQMTWGSPVFHDSFPPAVTTNPKAVLHLIEAVHGRSVERLRPVLRVGLPDAAEAELDELIRQVAPKTTAFCSAIPAGEIEDVNRLSAAAVAIATSYWADQSMDRGDDAMITAVYLLNQPDRIPNLTKTLASLIHARLGALRHIELNARHLARPEDVPHVVRGIAHDVLFNQAQMRELSRRYVIEGGGMLFWATHAKEIADLLVADAGLPSALTPIYAIYRQQRPELPTLDEIYSQPQINNALRVLNAGVRVFDDYGDRQIDEGRFAEWGALNINVFNQTNPKLLRAFLREAKIIDTVQQERLLAAFQAHTPEADQVITDTFLRHVRDYVAHLKLHWDLAPRYSVFLRLAQRVMEAGYVNYLGDIALAGTRQLDPNKATLTTQPESV